MTDTPTRIWLALAPALVLMTVLFGASAIYGTAQSLGYLTIIDQRELTLRAYGNVLSGSGPAREFWVALAFSLWISGVSTLLASMGALLLTLLLPRRSSDGGTLILLNLNLAFPHIVWAIALLLILAQSGMLARMGAALGLVGAPADFPVLVRDRAGVGIIIHYVTKEIPFLMLIVLSVLRSQPAAYDLVAENLGATPLQRLRLVTLPLVLPGLAAGALLVFAYIFGAYEVPALLGVRYPRTLAVLALEFFTNPDLRSRAEGMAISILMAIVVVAVAGAGRLVLWRRGSL